MDELFGIWRWPATRHRSTLGPPIDEPSIPLDSWRGILARGGLSLLSIARWPPFTVISRARVSLSRGQCSHANKGQSWKATDGGGAVGISIFPMPKHASRSWQNTKLRLREVFCTLGTSPPRCSWTVSGGDLELAIDRCSAFDWWTVDSIGFMTWDFS